MGKKIEFDKLNDEELVEILQKNYDRESPTFRVLFKRSTKKLYRFLISKGYSKYDSEDILQDYFGSYIEKDSLSHYERAIHSFNSDYSSKFINYIKRILILRLITRKYKVDQEKNVVSTSINKIIGEENTEIGDFYGKEDFNFNLFALEEIKRIVINHIFELESKNHKLAVICKLCLPFKITVAEIAEILEINERTLSTYIYRGIKSLGKKINTDPRLKNLSYENDILKFIELRLLHVDRKVLNELFNDDKILKIFENLLYNGKSIEELSEIFCIDIVEIKKIIKKGILKLISNKEYLLQ